jgi:hypothetical protein
MKVQNGFVQLMDVRRVKVAMGAISNTPTPITNEILVNNVEDEFSEVEDEIIVREAYSDSEFGSNHSDNA